MFTKEDTIADLNIVLRYIRLNLNNAKEDYALVKKIKKVSGSRYYSQINTFEEYLAMILSHEELHNVLLDEQSIETSFALDNIALRYRREGYFL